MKISACYIVKNEEKVLARSINSLRDYYDELIVVDTGSTDRTIAVAQAKGAHIYKFDWGDDFAKARNFALSQAQGNWVIFLDADEYYDGDISLRRYIEEIEKQGLDCDALLVALYEAGQQGKPPMRVARIFRHGMGLCYQGAIHETLFKQSGELTLLAAEELKFIHTGYHHGLMPAKLRRNLAILQTEAQRGQREPQYYYIAECYFGLQEYEKAVFYILKALESPVRYQDQESNYYHILIESLRQLAYPIEEQAAVARHALKLFPDLPEFYGELGMIVSSMGDYDEARDLMLKCIEQYLEKTDRREGYFSAQTMGIVYARLADIAYRLNQPVLAEIAGRLAQLSPDANPEWKKYSEALEEVYLVQLDEIGQLAYKYSPINKDNKYWLELWKHIMSLKDGQPKADTWLLVKLAIEQETDILPHEQVIFTLQEKYLWNIYWSRIRAQYVVESQDMPLVSVMIPTYNMPELFERTMRSAAIQDYPNLEIIVCDNSTNEDTATIMEMYRYDKRIRYIRNHEAKSKEENFMPFESLAQGYYLQWLMHDDILAPHKITRMVGILQKYPEVSLVGSLRQCIDENGNYISSRLEVKLPIEEEYAIYDDNIGFLMLRWCSNAIGEPSTVLFRRGQLKNHYWRAESRGLKTISDVAMWLELMEQGSLCLFKEPQSYYRRHPAQEGQQVDVVLLSRCEWYELITEYYRKKRFLIRHQDYIDALGNMYNEYKKIKNIDAYRNAPGGMWERYERTMEKCRLLQGRSGKVKETRR